jgi:hypothetical protein
LNRFLGRTLESPPKRVWWVKKRGEAFWTALLSVFGKLM